MVPKIESFEKFVQEYEVWFKNNPKVYEAEIKTIQKLLLPFERGIEIGIGTGKFALPFDIKTGVEPSKQMAKISEAKGIKVINGVAENLPLESETYDCVLMVTTICFVDNPMQSLKEVHRILTPGGFVIIGFIDRSSAIGKLYERYRQKSLFYKEAKFFTTKEVTELLEKTGFVDIRSYQTLFGNTLEDIETSIQEGSNEGAFVAIRATKSTK